MTVTLNRQGSKSIVIFGAGKIGRSFIGQLFSLNDYEVVFVDKNKQLIEELNNRTEYKIIIKSEPETSLLIRNFRGIFTEDKPAVEEALLKADLAATCVGKTAFPEVISLIGECLRSRIQKKPDNPLDIILAENSTDARRVAGTVLFPTRDNLQIPENFVGLVETSIGKMVPILPAEISQKDPLIVFAEPYNTLILDKNAFRNPAPSFPGLQLVDNIEAWVYRKALIHNLGHAAIVYFGYYLSPSSIVVAEFLDLPAVYQFAREVMQLSAKVLCAAYPNDFTMPGLESHIDELLNRFRNKALGDTVFRVGSDLGRKFGYDDRIFGAVRQAEIYGIPVDLFLKVAAYGLFFRATDENGNFFPPDEEAIKEINRNPAEFLARVTNFPEGNPVLRKIINLYAELKNVKYHENGKGKDCRD